MARGRPRKKGPRYPNGERKPDTGIRDLAAWNRLKDAGVARLCDARLATTIGRMWVAEQVLTTAEAAAGFHIAEVYGAFERANGLPRRTAASPSYEQSYGRGGADGIPEAERRARRASRAWMRLNNQFAFARMPEALERLCVDDLRPGPGELAEIKAALARLARFYGLDRA